jgi:cytidine deaminase
MNDIINSMIQKASKALCYAYAPYSKFSVCSCIYTADGSFFTGVNVENGSYGLTVCAETSAICQMALSGNRHIKYMVLLSGSNTLCTPCGGCRQRIYEFSDAETQLFLCDKERVLKTLSIDELLPMAFSFKG